MPIVVPNEGAPKLLRPTLGVVDATSYAWYVRLYKNDYTPVPGSTLGNFTYADFTGADPVALDESLWGGFAIVSDRAVAIYDSGTPIEWENTGSAQTVYGYVVYDDNDNAVLFAERFASPEDLDTLDVLQLVLKFTGGTEIP